ncbi:RsmD family RNA methyltransferase, partial [Salmonella enterica]|uniref:RsmD family RNA methyltransferase n=1 Tax=Salmonella enterica TaxID=28901 RepID=UPI003D2AA4A0
KAPMAFDLVFTDPPYADGLVPQILSALAAQGWIAPGALVVAEIPSKGDLSPPPGFDALDERTYGSAKLVFLRHR